MYPLSVLTSEGASCVVSSEPCAFPCGVGGDRAKQMERAIRDGDLKALQTLEKTTDLLTHDCWKQFINMRINKKCWTPLIFAVRMNQRDVVEYLVKCGADIHACTHRGRSALHVALINGLHPLVEVLLRAGANPFQQDEDGNSLYKACTAAPESDLAKIARSAVPEDVARLFSLT